MSQTLSKNAKEISERVNLFIEEPSNKNLGAIVDLLLRHQTAWVEIRATQIRKVSK